MKTFITTLFTVAFSLSMASAVTLSTTVTSETPQALLSAQGANLKQIIVTDDSTVANSVSFYDAPSTSLTFTNAAYTYIDSYETNLVRSYTDYSGVVTSTTNTVMWTVATTVSASTTNPYTRFNTVAVPADDTVTITFTEPFYLLHGVTAVVESTNATITLVYEP